MNTYNTEKRIFSSAEDAAVFYAEQAQRIQNDPTMAEVFQASCETGEMLLRLHEIESRQESK